MKSLKLCLLASTTLLGTLMLTAQTAEEIIAKHIEAVGGKEKIGQIKTVYMESSMEVMGNEAPNVTYLINGVGYRNELDFNGQKIIQVVTDKGGWAINPMAGSTDPQPIPEDQFKSSKDQIYLGGSLYKYASNGAKLELQGKENKDYKIKVTNADSVASTYFIDTATYLISKVTRQAIVQGQPMEINISFSNYQKTDFGYTIPFSTNSDFGQFQMASTLKKVEINKDIDPKILEMTKK